MQLSWWLVHIRVCNNKCDIGEIVVNSEKEYYLVGPTLDIESDILIRKIREFW